MVYEVYHMKSPVNRATVCCVRKLLIAEVLSVFGLLTGMHQICFLLLFLLLVFPVSNTTFLQNKITLKSRFQFNTRNVTPLILNAVRSVMHHLETTARFIPEALAADRA